MKSQNWINVTAGLLVVSVIGGFAMIKFPRIGSAMVAGGYVGAGIAGMLSMMSAFNEK